MKFFNEYKRQLITLAVIALAVISFFTAGSKINAGFFDDVFGFVVTPFQGAVASVTDWVGNSVDTIVRRTSLPTKTGSLRKR